MSKLKIGIIGCGGIANQKHFPALSQFKEISVKLLRFVTSSLNVLKKQRKNLEHRMLKFTKTISNY
ncbi:aspartate dehydrogenase [Neobacillus drentensis]